MCTLFRSGEWNKQKEEVRQALLKTMVLRLKTVLITEKWRIRNAGNGEREDIGVEWDSHEAYYNEEGVLNHNETVEGDEFDEMTDLCFDLRDLYDTFCFIFLVFCSELYKSISADL